MIDLGIFKTFRHGNAFERIAKLEVSEFASGFVALSCFFGVMVAPTALSDVAKDLSHGVFANSTLGFGGNAELPLPVWLNFFAEVTSFFEILDEIF